MNSYQFLLGFLYTMCLLWRINGELTTTINTAQNVENQHITTEETVTQNNPYTAEDIVRYQDTTTTISMMLDNTTTQITDYSNDTAVNETLVGGAEVLETSIATPESLPIGVFTEEEASLIFDLFGIDTDGGNSETSTQAIPADTTESTSAETTSQVVSIQAPDAWEPQVLESGLVVEKQILTNASDSDLVNKQEINVTVSQDTETTTIMTTTSSSKETGRDVIAASSTDAEPRADFTPHVPVFADVGSKQQTSNLSPGGKLKDLFSTTKQYESDITNIVYDEESHIKKSNDFHYPSHMSVLTGIILAIVGVSVLVGAFLVFKRKRTHIKRKLMMNFDLKRLDLWHLRQQPSNVLIVDFPLKHDEENWHDVKPVTSSVI
ncbi:uncharacterized protein LOC126821602 [Patella vulgata]|uniref:uncharacterized protein LOC126821602 n=1 Tax=Patella vulgata TaxID=6465 RepID=UPI00217F8F25|nr:uncharacterized protein LOC126821602 [Patella vulgata]